MAEDPKDAIFDLLDSCPMVWDRAALQSDVRASSKAEMSTVPLRMASADGGVQKPFLV